MRPPQEAERLEILALAREKLDIQYREDGPEMGFEFDSPPGQVNHLCDKCPNI